MATPSEKHEIHSPKRYLEYTENPFFRAFRDKENPTCPAANYAVLKRMEQAPQSIQAVEKYYEGTGAVPLFYSRPDSVTVEQCRDLLTECGYTVETYTTRRMMLLTRTSPDLLVHKCPVQVRAGIDMDSAQIQLLHERAGGTETALRLVRRQLTGGGRISFAYNRAEIPVSFCVGQGYGSAFYISDIYTAENCRRQGYGAAAVLAMLGFASNPDLGYTDVFLYTDAPDAISLLEKMGFRGVDVQEYRAYKTLQEEAPEHE